MELLRMPLQEQNPNIQENIFSSKNEPVKPLKATPTTVTKEHIVDHDVSYFRNLLAHERTRLLGMCEIWQSHLSETLNVDDADTILGDIRTVIGQAHLIMDERFSQFEGLVNNCEFHTSEKVVTCQDLQGFWDMVYFQVEDVNEKFADLEKRKQNQWKIDAPNHPKAKKKVVRKTNTVNKKASINPSAQARREEARKRLAAAKAALKKERRSSVTFDAGFFKVDSPARNTRLQPRTPHSKIVKQPASPSPANFMHGRHIRRTIGDNALAHVAKKHLAFEVTNQDAAEMPQKSPVSNNRHNAIDRKDNLLSSDEVNPPQQCKVERKSVSVMTDPCSLVAVGDAVEKIYKQMQVIHDVQGTLRDDNTAKLCRKIEELEIENADLKAKLEELSASHSCNENQIHAVVDGTDAYKSHYLRAIERVKLLEAELTSYRSLDNMLLESKEKWNMRIDQLVTKSKEAQRYHQHLQDWSERLREKEMKENEELHHVQQLNSESQERIKELERKTNDFDDLSEKFESLKKANEQQLQNYKDLSEECDLIRSERNTLRLKCGDQCMTIESLQGTLHNLKEENSFVNEEFINTKACFEEENSMLHTQLAKTEETLQSTLGILAKVKEKVNEHQSEIENLKIVLKKTKEENVVLQEENDITKANSRLAILEQQEEVINCETKLRDLVSSMTSFLLNLRKVETGNQRLEEDLPVLSEHPLKTPSKSLVVSALIRHASQGESKDWSPEIKFDREPVACLFGLVNDVISMMTHIKKTAAEVRCHHQRQVGQLLSDKKELTTTVQSLKQDLAERVQGQNEVELLLRKRIKEVITQRDQFKERLELAQNY